MKCPRCGTFCDCQVQGARPGSVLLAPITSRAAKGAWGPGILARAQVLAVEVTPRGTFVRVAFAGGKWRRRCLLSACRPVESLVEVSA